MSNLDNIISKVLEDAGRERDEIIAQAEQKVQEIIQNSERNSAVESEKMAQEAQKQKEQIKDKLVSQAQLRARDEKLSAKQDVIDRILDKTVEQLNHLDDQTYFTYLERKLKELNIAESDEIRVQKDKLEAAKNRPLPGRLSNQTVESGFSVLKGNVLYNNDFKSVIESQKDEWELEIVKQLFG